MPLEQLLKAHQPVKSSIDAMKAINIAKATTTIKIAAINARSTYLFGKDKTARVSDIKQGGIGDCWFLASLAGVVQKNPELIYKNIKAIGNGDFQVTLYEYFSHKPVIITVTDDDLNQSYLESIGIGTSPQQYAHKTDGNWVGIYETAMAKYYKEHEFDIRHTKPNIPAMFPDDTEYNRLKGDEKEFSAWAGMNFEYSGKGISILTGKEVLSIDIQRYEEFFTKEKWYESHISVATTMESSDGSDKDSVELKDHTTLYLSHAYTIIGVEGDKVKLNNPWGTNPNTKSGDSKDGVLTISMQEFKKYFSYITTEVDK